VTGLLASTIVFGSLATESEARRGRSKKIAPLTKEGLPNVQSESAFVFDLDKGALVYAKNPDVVREIASCGKIFVALVVLERGLDLDATTTITEIDREAAEGGSRSRLLVGAKIRNRDLMAAMLIGSDNRAPTALGRAVGLDTAKLTAAMTRRASQIGLARTRFKDPAGLHGNFSTAREMARALAVAMRNPVIAELMATRSYEVTSPDLRRPVHYNNTNRLLHGDHEVLGGKTGFTTAAGYCLITAAEYRGRRLVVAFLGSEGKLTRFADYKRVRGWLELRRPAPLRTGHISNASSRGR
jgi:D-alanyl-D-alanine endopeptidase (penicillin-binding protein 7)